MSRDHEAIEHALRAGDDAAFVRLFEMERARILRMVQFRLDPRLVGRIDPEDVVQDTFLDARRRLAAFRGDDNPFFVWLRLVSQQTMIDLHRRHIGTKMRSAGREVRNPQSHALSGFFVGHLTSPSRAAMREELRLQIEQALDRMEEIDREVLLLRHFEELSNKQVAEILGIQENAASNRYVRALSRLKGLLTRLQDS